MNPTIFRVTHFFKGAPKPPAPPKPPSPTTAAENAAKAYRERQSRSSVGFAETILTPRPGGQTLGGQSPYGGNSILGG